MGTMTADETYNGYANRETWAFNLHWQNDQGLYNETLARAREGAYVGSVSDGRTLEDTTDRELGEFIVTYWRDRIDEANELANEGEFEPFDSEGLRTLRMMDREVGSWWRIDYAEVGAAVRESLDVESD